MLFIFVSAIAVSTRDVTMGLYDGSGVYYLISTSSVSVSIISVA